MHRIKDERICSFCGEVSEGSFGGGKAMICARCHYFGNVQMGNIPKGSVYCFKCNTYTRFRAICPNGTVEFSYCADDVEGMPIYVPVSVKGGWDKSDKPNKIECGNCSHEILTDLMYLNNWTAPIAD